MRSDREKCGVHSASPSTFHQQPHHGDLPKVGWLGWGHREVPATGGFVEEVCVLYFTLRRYSWIS
uniref:Uncharacterized protein n=1 Tax=Arundo donax TaxID=35708 RepID=A0A0A9FEX0_ARUDO